MRLLLSSKYLASQLSEIDFNSESVLSACLKDDAITLNTRAKQIQLNVHVLSRQTYVNQGKVRWDWIYDLVSQANDQPVVLQLRDEGCTDVIFQY